MIEAKADLRYSWDPVVPRVVDLIDSMPMHRGLDGKRIGDENFHFIALADCNEWARALTIDVILGPTVAICTIIVVSGQ